MSSNVTIQSVEVFSDRKYSLKKIAFSRKKEDDSEQHKEAEVFNPGNAAAVLLYNKETGTVILTKQFRLPSYINGNPSGMLLEACAGKMEGEGESPEDCIRREAEEETGYKIGELKKLFQVYMSPGSVTELLHFFAAPVDQNSRVSEGGGLKEEQEEIEVVELPFQQALAMIGSGEIQDAKTIILLQYAQIQGYFAS